MNKFYNFFLLSYRNSSIEIQKKSKLFLMILFLSLFVILAITIIETLFNYPFLIRIPLFFGTLFIVFLLFFIRLGKYELTVFITITGYFIIISLSLLIDKYDNPFDIYRYSYLISSIIIISGIFSSKKKFMIVYILYGVIGIIIFFIYRYCFQTYKLNDPVTVMSFIFSLMIYIFFGLISILTLNITKEIIGILEQRENELTQEKNETLKMWNIIEVYTKPSIVQKVLNGENPTLLLPEKREMVILFSDLRNFTEISEHMDPKDVVDLLNPYFALMNSIIIENSGEIDKLIGDCIMALFNNSDDAVKSAIEMIRALNKDNEEDLNKQIKLRHGIGIHCGMVICGNIGSPWKMDYTVIGDVVNVASRLESLTKTYNYDIIISSDVKEKLNNNYELTELDEINIRGRTKPIKLYGISNKFL